LTKREENLKKGKVKKKIVLSECYARLATSTVSEIEQWNQRELQREFFRTSNTSHHPYQYHSNRKMRVLSQ
jgi:hypothetical protein